MSKPELLNCINGYDNGGKPSIERLLADIKLKVELALEARENAALERNWKDIDYATFFLEKVQTELENLSIRTGCTVAENQYKKNNV